MSGGYDSGYRECACFWGKDPSSLVVKLANLIPELEGLRVLDAGCGEGKNSYFFAERGAIVSAFDVSKLAIDHALKLMNSKTEKQIRFSVASIATLSFKPSSFDIVLAYGLLHCLPTEACIRESCKKLQDATAPGGYLLLCAFNDRHQELEAHPGFEPTVLPHEEYVGMFSEEWEIVEASDKDLTEVHPHNGIRHTHSMTRILGRRNLSFMTTESDR